MDLLIAKLILPFAAIFGLGAIGIAFLAFTAPPSSEPLIDALAEEPPAPPTPPAREVRGRIPTSLDQEPHQTLVIERRARRDNAMPSGARDRDLRGPDADFSRLGGPSARPSGSADRGPDDTSESRPARADLVIPSNREVDPRTSSTARAGERDDTPRARPSGTTPSRIDLSSLPDAPPDRTFRAQRNTAGGSEPERGGSRDMFDATRPKARDRASIDPSQAPRFETRDLHKARETREMDPPNPPGESRTRPPSAGDAGPPARPKQGERRYEAVGVNIVLQQPENPNTFKRLGHLEVVYGNFSPRDPREIPLVWPAGDGSAPRFVFSKSPGETQSHIQLNHYTISSAEQAELRFDNGQHIFVSLVEGEDAERYQIRVNGVALDPHERVVLRSGDIISMGIYRLKLSI